jgi:drug/metabolite transporter (DMT)-like permease
MGRIQSYVLLSLVAAFWGFQPSCVKWLLKAWSPVTIIGFRYVILSIILIAWSYYWERNKMIPDQDDWSSLVAMGLLGVALNNVLQFTALQYTTVTNCTLISATTPCLTAVASVIFVKERLHPLVWLGIVVSFLGVLTIVSKGSLVVLANIDFNRGDVLSLLSQMAWTGYTLIGVNVMKRLSPMAVTGWSGVFGSIMVVCFGEVTGNFKVTLLDVMPFMSFLYILLLGGLYGMVAWNACSKAVGPSIASIFLNIMPVVGMVAGFVLFNEEIGFVQLFGAGAIICGVTLVTNHQRVEDFIKARVKK